MHLKPISNESEYEELLHWVDEQLELNPNSTSKAGEKLQIALLLVKDFEDQNYVIPLPNPLEAIKLKMQEKGINRSEIISLIGSKSYVSAILSGKKPLTLKIAKILHNKLGVPAEVFFA